MWCSTYKESLYSHSRLYLKSSYSTVTYLLSYYTRRLHIKAIQIAIMPLIPSQTSLTHFKLLSFDVYGTLIDWEGGIYNTIANSTPFERLPSTHPLKDRTTLLLTYENLERGIQIKKPGMDYAELLSSVYKAIIADQKVPASSQEIEDESTKFGNSVGSWPVFPDTLAALHTLLKHYKLVPLTNCSPTTFSASLTGPFENFPFSAYHTAGEIGSYKPDLRNFHYLLEKCKSQFGVEKGEILHVAQSKHHDHVPAAKMGMSSCWVNRGGVMGDAEEGAQYGWEVKTLGELAGLVEEAFAEGK